MRCARSPGLAHLRLQVRKVAVDPVRREVGIVRVSSVIAVVLLGMVVCATAHAKAPAPAAEVGQLHAGPCRSGDAARAGARVVWCGSGKQRLATDVVWSKGRHAVAFATRTPKGTVTLRVAMVRGPFRGTLLSWPLTQVRRSREPLSVMWLGRDRVGVGRDQIRPLLVASWRLRNV